MLSERWGGSRDAPVNPQRTPPTLPSSWRRATSCVATNQCASLRLPEGGPRSAQGGECEARGVLGGGVRNASYDLEPHRPLNASPLTSSSDGTGSFTPAGSCSTNIASSTEHWIWTVADLRRPQTASYAQQCPSTATLRAAQDPLKHRTTDTLTRQPTYRPTH